MNVNNPLNTNQIIAGPLVNAWKAKSIEISTPPAITPNTGTIINKFAIPDVTWRIHIPISGSIIAVPYPATHPSNPHPNAAITATNKPNTNVGEVSPPKPVLPIKKLANTQIKIPMLIRLFNSCL